MCCSASACGPAIHRPIYSGPANLAETLDPLPIDSFYSQYVAIFDGGRKPAPVLDLTAHCEDESVCTTEVVRVGERASWPELRVIPKALGTAKVIVEFTHPTHKTKEQHRVTFDIVAAAPRPQLAIGGPIAAVVAQLIHVVKRNNADVPLGQCVESHGLGEYIAGSDRADVKLFTCDAVVAELGRVRRCFGMCPGSVDEHYTACATLAGGVVSSTTILDWDKGMKVKLVDGSPPPGACVPLNP
jgi:hypothetical protein